MIFFIYTVVFYFLWYFIQPLTFIYSYFIFCYGSNWLFSMFKHLFFIPYYIYNILFFIDPVFSYCFFIFPVVFLWIFKTSTIFLNFIHIFYIIFVIFYIFWYFFAIFNLCECSYYLQLHKLYKKLVNYLTLKSKKL